jgi:hypothetical protein
VATLGMGGGMAGQLHQGFGAAAADRFDQDVTLRIWFAVNAAMAFDTIIPASASSQPSRRHRIQRFGNVQMLCGMLAGSLAGRFIRGRGREHLFGDHPQLLRGERRCLLGQEGFQVCSKIVLEVTGGLLDDVAWSRPRSPASQALAVTGIRSASARPT